MQRFNVSIPKKTYANIKHYCVDNGIPVQKAIRDAVRAWCDKNKVEWIKPKT